MPLVHKTHLFVPMETQGVLNLARSWTWRFGVAKGRVANGSACLSVIAALSAAEKLASSENLVRVRVRVRVRVKARARARVGVRSGESSRPSTSCRRATAR